MSRSWWGCEGTRTMRPGLREWMAGHWKITESDVDRILAYMRREHEDNGSVDGRSHETYAVVWCIEEMIDEPISTTDWREDIRTL